MEHVSDQDVLPLIDYPAYFDLLEWPLPEGRQGILKALEDESLIWPDGAGNWSITNLGAILFAKRLSDFHSLGRKAVRVIHYRGNRRVETIKEQVVNKGYSSGLRV